MHVDGHCEQLCQRMPPMRGPIPSDRPAFPLPFLEQAARMAGQRTVAYQLRQQAALLLAHQPLLPNREAVQRVQLHAHSVRRWRHRWATGDFAVDDMSGRGRKANSSPAGPRTAQGGRLCTGRRNHATTAPTVPGRRHCAGPHRAGHLDQSQPGGWWMLATDAIKPWRYTYWIFPRAPHFVDKAGPMRALDAGLWQGAPLGPKDHILSADEKTIDLQKTN